MQKTITCKRRQIKKKSIRLHAILSSNHANQWYNPSKMIWSITFQLQTAFLCWASEFGLYSLTCVPIDCWDHSFWCMHGCQCCTVMNTRISRLLDAHLLESVMDPHAFLLVRKLVRAPIGRKHSVDTKSLGLLDRFLLNNWNTLYILIPIICGADNK